MNIPQQRQPAEGPKVRTCSVDGCNRAPRRRGRCGSHYRRWLEATAPQCSTAGCAKPSRARGLCNAHYQCQLNAGVPYVPPPRVAPDDDEVLDRLFSRVTPGWGGCWVWTGAQHGDGYGEAWHRGAKALTHRLVYELAVGPIPEGHVVDHTCHNDSGCAGGRCQHRRCINPVHLEAVTTGVNVTRSHLHNANITACRRGHEYTPKNTIDRIGRNGRPQRQCRTCTGEQRRGRSRRERGVE